MNLPDDYEHLEPIPWTYGFGWAVVSFVFFIFVRLAVNRFAIPAAIKEGKNRWKWQNILISWCHAVVVGVWVLACFYLYPEVTHDLIAFHNPFSYGVVAFSTGYFVSDFVDIVANSQTKTNVEVLLHHVAVLSIFVYNICICRYIGYTNVALLVEVHSVSLHLRKMMQMVGVSFQNLFYRLNNVVNILMFLGFRMLAIVWITVALTWYPHRMSTFYIWLLGTTMFVMWVINLILLWRLVKSDFLRRAGSRRVAEKNGKNVSVSVVDFVSNNNKNNVKVQKSV